MSTYFIVNKKIERPKKIRRVVRTYIASPTTKMHAVVVEKLLVECEEIAPITQRYPI